jgi:hypothetical protein
MATIGRHFMIAVDNEAPGRQRLMIVIFAATIIIPALGAIAAWDMSREGNGADR